ncbi:MAG TPA: type II toxin-antitoxin system HicB family antitoxin [Candidatus Hypogeohydataceae bacterium YC38]
MKTYIFRVIIEPDDDRWAAYCPALLRQGASTWGNTREEALKNIEEVVKMVIQSLREHGEPIPEGPEDAVRLSSEPQVAVTI